MWNVHKKKKIIEFYRDGRGEIVWISRGAPCRKRCDRSLDATATAICVVTGERPAVFVPVWPTANDQKFLSVKSKPRGFGCRPRAHRRWGGAKIDAVVRLLRTPPLVEFSWSRRGWPRDSVRSNSAVKTVIFFFSFFSPLRLRVEWTEREWERKNVAVKIPYLSR